MISKEEIEKFKFKIIKIRKKNTELISNSLTTLNEQEILLETNSIIDSSIKYIEQLETEKENIIKKLEKDSKQFDEQTKEIAIELNNARDFISTDEYEEAENEDYILNLKEKYKKVNIKRIRTNEILKIMKGENDEL